MKHETPVKRDPNAMLSDALDEGWQTVDTLPVRGDGVFLALTLSGLTRRAHNRNAERKARRADAYGPKRSTVVAVDSGNYLSAIAWTWPKD
ncbi:hypothetical protein A8B78_08375 [Jannaschia sp. EhC01]|nr:hypothetical protein A8B78_08375 [Jannaschia sp. EhC01]